MILQWPFTELQEIPYFNSFIDIAYKTYKYQLLNMNQYIEINEYS